MGVKLNPFTGKLDVVDSPSGDFSTVELNQGTQTSPSIAFDGDPNTGIYSPGADQLAISTNGTGRLFVDANGNVGIGASPSIKLYVYGASASNEIRSDNGSVTSQWYQDPNGYGVFGTVSNHAQVFRTNETERLRITSAGLVGIGTSSPGSVFEISQANGGDIRITNPTNYGGVPATNPSSRVSNGISWQGNGQTGYSSTATIIETNYIRSVLEDLAIGNPNTQGRYALAFGTSPGGAGATPAIERMRIDYAGRVGIGTASPAEIFDCQPSSTLGFSIGKDPADSTKLALRSYQGSTNNNVRSISYIGSDHRFQVGAVTGTTASEVVRIDSSGRVGIGTTSPEGALEIDADGDGTQLIIKRKNPAQNNGLQLQDQGGNTIGFFNVEGTSSNRLQIGSSNEIAFHTSSSFGNPPSNERARIDSSGRLLVGTSSSVNVGSSVPAIQQIRYSSSNVGLSIVRDGNAPNIVLARTASAPYGLVSSGNALGSFRWAAGDGTDIETIAAEISCEVDGTPGTNDMPGRLVFSTTAATESSPTERVRIDKAGAITLSGNSSSSWFLAAASDDTSYGSIDAHFPTGNRTLLINSNTANNSFVVWNRNSASSGKGFGLEGQNFKVVQGSTEQIRVDSSGRLLVGTTSTANRGDAKHIVQGDVSFGNGLGKAHTIYKETANLANAGTFDVDLISGTGTCCGFGTVFYSEGTNQQVQTFSFAGRQTGAVVQLQDTNTRNSGVSGVTVSFTSVSSAGKIRITNGSGATLGQVQVTLFLHSTLS